MIKKYLQYKKINSTVYKEAPGSWNRYRVKDTVDRNTYYPVGDGDHGSIKPEMYIDEGVPYIRVQNLTWHGEINTDGIVYISDEVQRANKKSILYPGDILIAKTGATIGKLGIIPENIKEANTTSSVGKLTVDKTRFNPNYILYCFQSRAIQDQIWLEASQKSAQPGFNIDDLIVLEILAPGLDGQSKIVQYLDHQTNIIDQLIQQKEKLIVLLKEKRQAVINEAVTKGLNPKAKMKDSGIEWLGEINSDWQVKKIKHTTFVKGRIGWQNLRADDFLEEGPYLVTGTDFEKGRIKWEGCHRVDEERYLADPFIILQENDVLITKDGTIGKVAIIKNKPNQVTLNSGVFVTRPLNNDYLSDYMFWILNSEVFSHFYDFNKSGSTIQHLYQNVFVEFSFAIPTLAEQKKIVDYLTIKSKAFDELIKMVTNCVNRLMEYRQSIISEAVTGKIDVREWQPNKQQVA
jgi:type I restriction enzyme S subunit